MQIQEYSRTWAACPNKAEWRTLLRAWDIIADLEAEGVDQGYQLRGVTQILEGLNQLHPQLVLPDGGQHFTQRRRDQING